MAGSEKLCLIPILVYAYLLITSLKSTQSLILFLSFLIDVAINCTFWSFNRQMALTKVVDLLCS
jgi:L-lactate permease